MEHWNFRSSLRVLAFVLILGLLVGPARADECELVGNLEIEQQHNQGYSDNPADAPDNGTSTFKILTRELQRVCSGEVVGTYASLSYLSKWSRQLRTAQFRKLRSERGTILRE